MACDVITVRLHLAQIRGVGGGRGHSGRAGGERRVDVQAVALCAVRVQVPPGA